jgi:6-phosphogluconolactonase
MSDAESNFSSWLKHVFTHVPLHPSQLHTIADKLPNVPVTDPEEAAGIARTYEHELVDTFGDGDSGTPSFDLVLLELGPDGHTCGLIHGHSLLDEQNACVAYCRGLMMSMREKLICLDRLVAALTDGPEAPGTSITFTLPLLCNSKHVAFVVSGESRSEALAAVLEEPELELPGSRIVAARAPNVYFADRAAVSETNYPQSTFPDAGEVQEEGKTAPSNDLQVRTVVSEEVKGSDM